MIEDVAAHYADDFHSADELAEGARKRLSERLRRAADRVCAVCGGPLIGRRIDAITCSTPCRQKRSRLGRVNDT